MGHVARIRWISAAYKIWLEILKRKNTLSEMDLDKTDVLKCRSRFKKCWWRIQKDEISGCRSIVGKVEMHAELWLRNLKWTENLEFKRSSKCNICIEYWEIAVDRIEYQALWTQWW
jgi:hypothetical protein